ncbi:MAG TPA: hypothetical protein VJH94_02000 [Candidatus Paceibacterota bacterium]
MTQLDLHKKINGFIEAGVDRVVLTDVREAITVNFDARKYFYSRVDDNWFDWLWKNSFFDLIKKKAEDTTQYSYRTPELDYHSRVVEKIPGKVVDFMLTVPVSRETFNPEVIDRFLWISSKLPAKELARIVPKIRDQQWVRLMGPFNRWGFEYKQMFEKLVVEQDHASIIALAQAILLVRTKEEFKKTPSGVTDNPFFFNDLHHTEVFERLAEVDDAHLEDALRVAAQALGNVVKTGEKEDKVFDIGEMFHLFDVDFFSLEVGDRKHYSFRDDVRDLAAAVKTLVTRAIGGSSEQPDKVRHVYKKYIDPMPDSRSLWRLRLYVWSLCPEIFKNELKEAFFRAFESEETLWPITGGAEYEHALKRGFSFLSEADQKEYIRQALDMLVSKENHSYGFGIFSTIYQYLTKDQIERIEKAFKLPLKPEYQPEPSIMREYAGTVVPQTPPKTEPIWAGPISGIVEAMKAQWTPEELHKMDGEKDFLRPINAEGVADKMRAQIKERIQEYTQNTALFFDREHLDAHYTYSFLRGIQEAIRANRGITSSIDWAQVVVLGKMIVAEGKKEPFDFSKREREKFDAWLAGWIGVHSSLADVFEEFLRDENGISAEEFLRHRDDVLSIIDYLLTVPDPLPKDEMIGTAGTTTLAGGEELVSDPFSIAINSARGRAYQAFVLFMEVDGRKYPKEATSRLDPEVLKIYQELLARENTAAIMFMYGHYLPFFYFRDVENIKKLLPEIFTVEPEKEHLYLAAWEGYLTRALYRELYDLLQGEYKRAISLDSQKYPKRSYRADLDDALATHIALAYMHFEDVTLDSELFKLFWLTTNKKRHQAFVSFIGRHIISRDRPKEFLKDHLEIKLEKLMQFWDWLLKSYTDPDVFAEFGFWMNTMDGPYEDIDIPALAKRIRATLEKSDGRIDWELKFMDSLPSMAEKAPIDTVEILRLYFTPLDTSPQHRHFMHIDANLVEVFRKLYQNPTTKEQTYQLIDELLPLGNGVYWQLKEALNEV